MKPKTKSRPIINKQKQQQQHKKNNKQLHFSQICNLVARQMVFRLVFVKRIEQSACAYSVRFDWFPESAKAPTRESDSYSEKIGDRCNRTALDLGY